MREVQAGMKGIVGACVASILLTATLAAQELSSQSRPAATQRGAPLYRNHCARCHGLQGLGGTGPSLTRPVLRHARSDKVEPQHGRSRDFH